MSVSVLVVAHNEEKFIKRCLESLSYQTKVPDEIVLIAHNCTDNTVSIAREFKNVRIIEHATPEEGVVFARIRGFEEVKGDIVAYIDGDSMAFDSWVERITRPFEENPSVSMSGGFIFFNKIIPTIWSISFFFLDPIFKSRSYRFYPWGGNFACKKEAYLAAYGLRPLIELHSSLKLHYWAEDLYLFLVLSRFGRVIFCPRAVTFSDGSLFESDSPCERARKQDEDRKALLSYFSKT